MAELNHTIVRCRDKAKSAAFLTDILALPPADHHPVFRIVRLANGVSLDFEDVGGEIVPQHYAFLLSDAEFDAAFAKIGAQGLAYWADPLREKPGEVAHLRGARAVYFQDPDGHYLELMTRMTE